MPYRTMKKPPLKPEAKLPVFSMHNGTDAVFSVPCFYLEIEPPEFWHDYHLHDHIGWPSHNHPDHICQRLPGNVCPVPRLLHPGQVPPHPLMPHGPHPHWVYEYVDMNKAEPIHWYSDDERYTDEIEGGYTPVAYVTFDQADVEDSMDDGHYTARVGEYIIAHDAWIREDEDWIIDMGFSVDGPAFEDKPQRLLLTLFVAMQDSEGGLHHRQEVVRGWLEILPSASYEYIEGIKE